MTEIDALKARIDELEQENMYLKDFLTKAGIEYAFTHTATDSAAARRLPE